MWLLVGGQQDAAGWWVFTVKAGRRSISYPRRWLNWVILRHSHKLTEAPLTVKASPTAAPWHLLWSQQCLEVFQVPVGTGNLKPVDWNPLLDQTLVKSPPSLNDDRCAAPWERQSCGTRRDRNRARARERGKDRNKECNSSRGSVESRYQPPHHHRDSSMMQGARLTAL